MAKKYDEIRDVEELEDADVELEEKEDSLAEKRKVKLTTSDDKTEAKNKNGEIVENDYMSLSYYNKVASGETIKKKWSFTEFYDDNDSDDQNKKETEIIITDRRLILLSDDGNRINKISRNIEDVQGVGYTVKKKTDRKVQGKLKISVWAFGFWAFAAVMLLGALIGPSIVGGPGGAFKYGYILAAIAICVSIIFIKRETVEETVSQKAFAVTLEFYIKPYQEIQPIGSIVFGKDRSVVEITVPGGDVVVEMLAEIDNIITEVKYNLCDNKMKVVEIENPTVKTHTKKTKKSTKK